MMAVLCPRSHIWVLSTVGKLIMLIVPLPETAREGCGIAMDTWRQGAPLRKES